MNKFVKKLNRLRLNMQITQPEMSADNIKKKSADNITREDCG